MAKPRLFISYGRADATPLAERLEIELQDRGFDVWRDKTQLRAGQEWERQIIDGLRSTQLVVALLSPHSTRKLGDAGNPAGADSVCLDELAWARFEPPPNPIVPALAVPGADIPLTIFRLQYVDMVGALNSEPFFQEKLTELLGAIDDALRGKTRYRAWDDWLRPSLEFDRFLFSKRVDFTGRQWLFDQIDAWRRTGREPALLIKGDPGIGKSAIIAEMTHGQFHGSTLATYCCQWDTAQTLKPAMFVRMVASQIASRLSAYAAMLETPAVRKALDLIDEDPASALEMGLFTPLNSLPAPENSPRLILIDALDEALGGGSYTIAHLLRTRIDRMPPWMKIVATTRREPAVLNQLGGLPYKDIDAHGQDNASDLAAFVRKRLGHPELASRLNRSAQSTGHVVATLLRRADGNFLYVQQVLESIQRDLLDVANLDQLPPGLSGIYDNFFSRVFPGGRGFDQVQPLLAVVCSAREQLPRSLLVATLSLSDRDLVPRLKQIGQFLRIGGEADPLVAIWHKSLTDWLTSLDRAGDMFTIDPREGHTLLAHRGWTEHSAGGSPSGYFLRNLPAHLREAGQRDRVLELLLNYDYLQNRADAGLIHDMADEFRLASGICPPTMSPRAKFLSLLERAFRREASTIALHRHLLLQSIWHLCYWYDASESPEHYLWKTPGEADDTGHPWNEPGEKLSALMTDWCKSASRRHDAGIWLRSVRPAGNTLDSPLIATLRGHDHAVYSVAITSDGRRIVSGSADKTVRVWDATDGREIVKLHEDNEVTSVAITSDGRRIFSGSADKTVRVWDADSGREISMLRGHANRVTSLAITPDGQLIVSGSWDKTARVWNADSGREIATIRGHDGWVASVAITSDGRRIVSGSYDKTVCVWDVGSSRAHITFRGHSGRVTSVAITPDGRRVVSGSHDQTIRVWDVEGGCEMVLVGHEGWVYSVGITPDGRQIVSGSWDKTVRVWDADSGRLIATLHGDSRVAGVAITCDGRRIVSGSDDNSVRVWDPDRGRQFATLRGHDYQVTSAAITSDGRRIVSGSWDKTIRVWNAESGRELAVFRGHDASVHCVAITPDGRRIVSGGGDDTVRVWDAESGREMATFRRHACPVHSVEITADSRRIISRDSTGKSFVWDIDTLTQIDRPAEAPQFSNKAEGFLWPGGNVMLCNSGDYAVVRIGNDVIPCKVERPTGIRNGPGR